MFRQKIPPLTQVPDFLAITLKGPEVMSFGKRLLLFSFQKRIGSADCTLKLCGFLFTEKEKFTDHFSPLKFLLKLR